MVYELFIDHEVSSGMIWDIVCVKKFMCIEQGGMGGCIEQGGWEVSHCSYATIPIGLELWIRSKLICWCWGESSARFIYTPRCITQYTFMNRKCIERLRCMGLLINNKTTQSTYAAVNHFGAYYDSRRPK